MTQSLPETLCVKEVAAHLGISSTSAYKLLLDPSFPSFRIGKVYRIPRKQFLQWIAEQTEHNGKKEEKP